MKTFFAKPFGCGLVALCAIALPFLAAWPLAAAPLFQEARVSEVIRDVRLLEAHGAPRPAVVNDKVTPERAVRTGVESRAELTFTDLTITRLGANTIFTLMPGSREVDLTRGTILLEVPSGKAPVKASTGPISVGVTGGTALLGTGPPIKFMVLEGTGTMYPKGHPEKAVSLKGGEMVMATANGKISQPAQFDVKLVLATSHLILDFPPLTNLPLILAVMNQQLAAQQLGGTTSQSLAKNLVDVIDVTGQNANANPVVVASTASTAPIPSEFGSPSTITSPVPYLITSGTVITTDPTITTNGVTDFGKIYRDPVQDGPLPTFLFGSTSAFDNTINFGTNIDPSVLPLAVFKFRSLSLVGNPTINLGTGGTTKLVLVGVDGITTGLPGGTLTFSGLDLLGLITQAGSINLTSDVSFQNISRLFIYARGAGSNLTLDSPITGSDSVELNAEGSMQLMLGITTAERLKFVTGGDLVTTGPGGSAEFEVNNIGGTIAGTSGDRSGNITLRVGGNLSSQSLSLLIANNAGGNIGGTGGNIDVTTGGNFTTSGDATFTIQNIAGTINDGANVSLDTGGNLTINGGGLSLTVNNSNGGQIGTGGNISVTTVGNLVAAGDASFQISNELDSGVSATRGGIIGGDTTLNISANTVSVGGLFVDLFNENDQGGAAATGGHIGGGAAITVNVNGALTDTGRADVSIYNYGFGDGSPGGFIGSNASVNLTAGSITTSGDTVFSIENFSGGSIGGSAAVTVTAGSLSAGELAAEIANGNFTGGSGSLAGRITGAASITFNISGALVVAGSDGNDGDEPNRTVFDIDNSGFGDGSPAGYIGSDASINISAGSISETGKGLSLLIFNFGGGTIAGNASLSLNAGSVTANSLLFVIDNSLSGSIGGNATINMNVSGDINTVAGAIRAFVDNGGLASHIKGDATINVLGSTGINAGDGAFFAIVNEDAGGGTFGGTIDGNALVHVTANHLSTEALAPSSFNLFGTIHNSGGKIGGNCDVKFDISGAITTAGRASFDILNFDDGGQNGGGTIGGNATVSINAGALSIGSDLLVKIINNGGVIDGNATIDMNVSGNADITNDATVAIYGSDGVAKGAAINFNGGSYSVGGTFLSTIDGDGMITFNNASVHANVLEVGALGTNGVLNIGGGTLSADTTLKLYASGSNGQLNFVSNVTLGGNSTKILAANSVTIFNNVTVTIGGTTPANVYTNNANYTGFGGNGSTTGTFAGAGANSPQALSSAPPFGDPPATVSKVTSGKTTGAAIDVSSTGELLSLLDGAPVGPDGKITISGSHSISNLKNLGGTNINGLSRADRRMLIQQMRDERRDTARVGGKQTL
jgi:hypothetical protein